MESNNFNKALQYAISFLLIGITLVAIFTPVNGTAKVLTDYTNLLMLGMLGMGFLGLFWGQKKVMVSGLACCAALCLFLKGASNNHLVLPIENEEANISVAHFNVSNVQDIDHLFQLIRDVDADILSFQELTPDWNHLLQDSLINLYPHHLSLVRIDPYGMALYSKSAYESMDTFLFDGKPNLDAELTIQDQKIHIVGSYVIPGNSSKTKDHTRAHLDKICRFIQEKKSSVIALGDYNMVYWANEISKFKSKAKVQHSRRDVAESRMMPPYDHIFYTSDMECTKFENIADLEENHIGIVGTYQLRSEEDRARDKATLSSYSF